MNNKIPRLIGLISSSLTTFLGAIYFLVLFVLIIKGNFNFPPSEGVQLFGAISTIISVPLIIMIITAIHYMVPEEKKILSSLAIIFSTIFSIMVSINRFVQLGMVRISISKGDLEDLKRFYPYDSGSAMFVLEMIGWGTFLSLGLFFAAFALNSKGILKYVRFLFFLYTILGLISSVAFLMDSPASAIGFLAWGVVLFIATGLLGLSFYKYEKYWFKKRLIYDAIVSF